MDTQQSPVYWTPGEVIDLVKVWATNKAGAEYRQLTTAAVMGSLISLINHLAGRHPRILFTQTARNGIADTSGQVPLYIWGYVDDVTNGRDWQYRINHLPRSSGSGDAYAWRYLDATTLGSKYSTNHPSPSFPEDVETQMFNYERGAAAGTAVTEGLNTANGYTALDVCVQDLCVGLLFKGTHTLAHGFASEGRPVLAGLLEQLRSAFHELRTTNLPFAFQWSAQDIGSTPAATGPLGIKITTTTATNVIDGSSTSRTATTPGVSAHVYRGGRGAEGTTNGNRIPVTPRVYGSVTGGGGDCLVSFTGPLNSVDVRITNGGGLAWYAASSNLYLNAAAEYDDTTTARNKIDIMGEVTSGDTGSVFAITGPIGWDH